ncbi:MAG: cbb3-type cytochrome c oxidase subunit I [Chitinophagaceae bacterium]|nr:cbb3-type cytochrome c oxidase subunit I [Chitinophagaceae bacterium]MCZ2395306.1 cbb3-type cytochrome c oxidase subunit I [Chitinophagales bacterium]
MEIKYNSQRLAYPFFVSMLILFALQIGFGLLLALIQMDPDLLKGTFNFNVARAFHLNLAIVWIVTGFIGTILFVGPILGQRDVRPRWLAILLLIAIWIVVLWSIATLPLAQVGIAGWVGNTPWLQQGMEFLEGGRVTDILLFIGFGIFAYLTLVMFPKKVKRWNELHWGLAIGVVGLVGVWIFTMIPTKELDLQEYFRWYVVHYWVEAVWEIIHITLIGFLLARFFGADDKEVGFAVFWGISLVVLSGLIGNSHHYFWIGTPAFWQFWGSLFSALEPLPLIFCIWHVYLDEKHGVTPIKNRAAFYFIFGSALFESVGAGVLGFTMTMAYANLWEHGTWLTAAHGHMALFGAFGLLVIGAAYEAVRQIKGINRFKDGMSKLSFWMLFVGLSGIVGSFAFGGTKQIYVYRILGLDWWGHQIRPAMSQARVLLGVFAFLFVLGGIIVIYDLLTLKDRAISETNQKLLDSKLQTRGNISWWRRSMTQFEFGVWLSGIWLFGLIVTAGVFSFNLHSVRLGDPTIPYIILGIGYPGLLIITLVFAHRFLMAFEQRQDLLQVVQNFSSAGQLQVVDIRNKAEKGGEREQLILDTFNRLSYGEAFMVLSDRETGCQHHTLHKILGTTFAWEVLEAGPQQWKVKVGKLN